MTSFIIALVFLLLALAGEVARKTYYYVPVKEMKRQAEAGDELSRKLYEAVSYGRSLRALLWLYISVMAAVGVVLLSRVATPLLGIIAVVLLLWVFYSWLPASRVTRVGAKVTTLLNPVFLKLLHWLHPVLSRSAEQVEKRYSAEPHTGLYEKADLLELIERQQKQPGGRFTPEELEIASRALKFDEYKVRDILTPRSEVKTVKAHDTLGPIVIDELHKSEQPFALVADKDEHDIVGVLPTHDLGIQSNGKVSSHMQSPVHFLHEADTLATALHAYNTTNSSLFVVVNNHEEYVGVITIQSILNQLLGALPADDFDDYASRQAVAARHDPKAELEDAQAVADQLAAGEEDGEEEPEEPESPEISDFEEPAEPDEPDIAEPDDEPGIEASELDDEVEDFPVKVDLSKPTKDKDIETITLDDDAPEPENETEETPEEPESTSDDDPDFEIVEEDEDDHPAPRS